MNVRLRIEANLTFETLMKVEKVRGNPFFTYLPARRVSVIDGLNLFLQQSLYRRPTFIWWGVGKGLPSPASVPLGRFYHPGPVREMNSVWWITLLLEKKSKCKFPWTQVIPFCIFSIRAFRMTHTLSLKCN